MTSAGCSGVDTPDPTLDAGALATIKAAAEKATAGPWYRDAWKHKDGTVTENVHARQWDVAVCEVHAGDTHSYDGREAAVIANADYIATMAPDTGLALVAEVVRLRAEVETARAEISEIVRVLRLYHTDHDGIVALPLDVEYLIRKLTAAARLVREAPE